MGKIKQCAIDICDRRQVFRPGETVRGKVTIEVEGDTALRVKGIVISCRGQALTKWTSFTKSRWADDPNSTELYVNLAKQLETGNPVKEIPPGKYSYTFNFRLPLQSLPSSFEGRYGAIRYWLRVEVDKPFPSINDKYHRGFTVLAHLDMNEAVYRRPPSSQVTKTLSKALGFGDAGNLSLSASLDRTGYCPGEKIAINLEAKNESTKDCGCVKASLIQRVAYTAGGENETTTTIIRTLEGDKLAKGKTTVWHQQLLLVDALPPSSKQLTCHIIKVTYSVAIVVEVPLGIDLCLNFPIKIGTAPLGLPVPADARLVSGAYVNQQSLAINYGQCTRGIQKFTETVTNFPNMSWYVPWTVYVKNYRPGQATPQTVVARTPAAAATPPAPQTAPNTGAPRRTNAPQPRPLSAALPPSVALKHAEAMGQTSPHEAPAVLVTPSAPPSDLPPSYEETCATPNSFMPIPGANPTNVMLFAGANPTNVMPYAGANPTNAMPYTGTLANAMPIPGANPTSAMPTPYYMPPEEGKGSILFLQFPELDIKSVAECFKRTVPNMLLHGGKVLAFVPQLSFFPAHPTAAIVIYFGAERIALSWLQNMTSADSQLVSRWWVLIGENKVENMAKPGDASQFGAISLVLLKRNIEFKPTKACSDEYMDLLKTALRPTKAKHGGKTILSGKTTFAGGDWSSFPAKASELTFTATQFPTIEHRAAYIQEFVTNPSLVRCNELLRMLYTRLFTDGFPNGDTSMFQDL